MDMNVIYEVVFAVLAAVALIYGWYVAKAMSKEKLFAQITELVNVICQAVAAADAFYEMTNEQRYKYVSDQAALQGVILPPGLIEYVIEGAVTLIHRRKDEAAKNTQ